MEKARFSVSDVQVILQNLFADPSLIYDHSRYTGGMTNYNYITSIHGVSYVVREPGFKTEQIIDRAAEQRNNQIASDLGINSECVYFDRDSGIKISRFIDQAQTFTDINPASDCALSAVAALLKKIHSSPAAFFNDFCWETELAKYESIVRSMNCEFFSDYEQRRRQLLDFMGRHVVSLRLRPCHNDTVPENFLMDRQNGSIYLIDWEYSGMNDPAWDIAMYIAESCLPRDAIGTLLACYYGSSTIPEGEIMKLKCFVMVQDLLWSVWAMIRHYSGEDFLDYLYDRYSRLRRNLDRLTAQPSYPLAEMVKA